MGLLLGLLLAAQYPAQEDLLHVFQWHAFGGYTTQPPTVTHEVEARGVFAQRQLELARQLSLGAHIGHPDQRLDPAVPVAVPQVGRTDPELLIAGVAEPQDPRVFQEATDDGPYPDPFGQPGYAGSKG